MPDPIRFDVSNPQTPQAGAVVYISDDTGKWGRLDITLTNPSTDNSDLKLDPGGVLQIYLEMLTPDDITNITLPADSAWAGGPDTTNRHLELHPKQTITIPSQNSISIELHNVLGHTPRQGKFRFYDRASASRTRWYRASCRSHRGTPRSNGDWRASWIRGSGTRTRVTRSM